MLSNPARRALLAAVGAFGAGGLVWRFGPRRVEPFCPEDPRNSDNATPLTIDVHTHVFNASDLQVQEFIQRVVLKQNFPWRDIAAI